MQFRGKPTGAAGMPPRMPKSFAIVKNSPPLKKIAWQGFSIINRKRNA